MHKLISEYIKLTLEYGNSMENGNDLKSNKTHSKIQKLITHISNSETKTKSEFYGLLSHSNSSVRIWTAIELIGTDEENSLKIIKEISNEKGINGLNAKTILEMWEKGLIKKTNWMK